MMETHRADPNPNDRTTSPLHSHRLHMTFPHQWGNDDKWESGGTQIFGPIYRENIVMLLKYIEVPPSKSEIPSCFTTTVLEKLRASTRFHATQLVS